MHGSDYTPSLDDLENGWYAPMSEAHLVLRPEFSYSLWPWTPSVVRGEVRIAAGSGEGWSGKKQTRAERTLTQTESLPHRARRLNCIKTFIVMSTQYSSEVHLCPNPACSRSVPGREFNTSGGLRAHLSQKPDCAQVSRKRRRNVSDLPVHCLLLTPNVTGLAAV